jgi:periplasmic protein TonB
MARARSKGSLVFMISVGAHLVVGAALALIPQERLREVVGIAFSDTPKPKPAVPKAENRPAPKLGPARAARAAAAAAPAPAAAAEAANNGSPSAFANLGISLDSSSADGIAVPVAARLEAPKVLAAIAPKAPKLLVAQKALCLEELKKATPDRIVRPEYTTEARRAEIEGRVRLQLEIDENGFVRDAKVLSGLGHGLDEQAILAAKKMQFNAATHCGKPVPSTFVLAMRFALGS